MGGFGSGRRKKHPAVYEDTHRLDIRQLASHCPLEAGSQFGWFWTGPGGASREIWIEVKEESLRLCKRFFPEENFVPIQIHRTPCHFGGSRPWFQCPYCHRRCAVLIAFNDLQFACRKCLSTPYQTQSMGKHARAVKRRNLALAQLEEANRKPGRWRSTIERLEQKYWMAEFRANQALIDASRQLFNTDAC